MSFLLTFGAAVSLTAAPALALWDALVCEPRRRTPTTPAPRVCAFMAASGCPVVPGNPTPPRWSQW